MPIYVMLSSLTDEGRKTIRDNADRIKEVNTEVESMGIKILAQYALLGPYDFLNVLDAPSDAAISKMAIEIGGRGTLRTMTMSAMDIDGFVAGLKKK
ncbi:MAG: GYD domain-containing protein [Chloroflexota bacterium]|nr:GYD domain-containing protein [Chloroflexota bacterium]